LPIISIGISFIVGEILCQINIVFVSRKNC